MNKFVVDVIRTAATQTEVTMVSCGTDSRDFQTIISKHPQIVNRDHGNFGLSCSGANTCNINKNLIRTAPVLYSEFLILGHGPTVHTCIGLTVLRNRLLRLD